MTETNDLTFPQWGADLEHDDLMDAEDFDRRRAIRDGWTSDTEGRW